MKTNEILGAKGMKNQNQRRMEMATSRDFVDAVVSKNNLDAEDAFKSVMNAKVGDALEIKRKEVAQTFVKDNVTDAPEVEETEEA